MGVGGGGRWPILLMRSDLRMGSSSRVASACSWQMFLLARLQAGNFSSSFSGPAHGTLLRCRHDPTAAAECIPVPPAPPRLPPPTGPLLVLRYCASVKDDSGEAM